MKYNWRSTANLLIILAVFLYAFAGRQNNSGEGVIFCMLLEQKPGNVISVKDMGQTMSTALEQKNQTDCVNQYLTEILSEMTLEQKLAQMMILTSERDITKTMLATYQPGGIILFSKDFDGKTAAQVKEQIEGFQADADIPLFIGVDEEGGEVSRISGMQDEKVPVFQSARQLYETGGTEAVYKDAIDKTKFLASMGINLNFAPVADVVENESSYMYDRSASGDPEEVAGYVAAVVDAMALENMGCCVKHFPGYGENANTHLVYAIDQKELSDYRNRDFIPFNRGIAAGADMIMVSHIVMTTVDAAKPASLSPSVHVLLREELGFDGVIMADDLNMRAVLNQMTLEEAAAEALAAGNDMIFSADFNAAMQGAKKAVEAGKLSVEQIDASVTRILKMKINQELISIPERN